MAGDTDGHEVSGHDEPLTVALDSRATAAAGVHIEINMVHVPFPVTTSATDAPTAMPLHDLRPQRLVPRPIRTIATPLHLRLVLLSPIA